MCLKYFLQCTYVFSHIFILAFIGKDIKFEYLVNGQSLTENRLDPLDLQSYHENQSEEFMKRLWAYKRIKYMLANNNSCWVEPIFENNETEMNTEEIIDYNFEDNYDYDDDHYDDEQDEQEDIPTCIKPATNLALKYGFVTDLTSLLVEENVLQTDGN